MGQREVLDLLIEKKRWFTADEITEKIGISRSSINHSLRFLMKAGLIKFRKCKKMRHGYEYCIISGGKNG